MIGVAIRADVPITIDFLPCFWKSLKGESLSLEDLKAADYVTYNLTCKILEAQSVEELEEVVKSLGHICEPAEEGELVTSTPYQRGLQFVYSSLNGMEVELVPGGREIVLE